MNEIIAFLREFNFYTVLIRIALAIVLGGAMGMEREIRGHAAGFRTHILVCLGAAMTILVGLFAVERLGVDTDPLRLGAQVVSGIGFLGVGTILVVGNKTIKGLTTAAGLWATAVVGLAVGAGFYEGAILCTVALLLVVARFKRLDYRFSERSGEIGVYFEVADSRSVNAVIDALREKGLELRGPEVSPAGSGIAGQIGIEATVSAVDGSKKTGAEMVAAIASVEQVTFALDRR